MSRFETVRKALRFPGAARHTIAMRKTGEPAPDFSLPDTTGVLHTLPELLGRGQVLLTFFKISCPVCQLILPFLERLWNGRRVHVIGISQNDRESTRRFIEHYRLTFPVLLDPEGSYPASNAYGLTNVPSTFLVEKDSTITWASTGFDRKALSELGVRFATEIFGADDKVPEWKPG